MRTLRDVAALTAAVKLCHASTLGVPHGETRAWLLKIAAGNFNAKPAGCPRTLIVVLA
jgi:hypothetical protein